MFNRPFNEQFNNVLCIFNSQQLNHSMFNGWFKVSALLGTIEVSSPWNDEDDKMVVLSSLIKKSN